MNCNNNILGPQAVQPRQRMVWVDAMRGFSMLIVVFGHVLGSMGIGGYASPLSSILLTFRMPLFFFVSGFFSFRAIQWWTAKRAGDIMKRKIQAQVICTVVFVSVYQYVIGGGDWWYYGFGGYWFTIVLFQMYCCYLGFSLLSRLLKRDIAIPAMIIISAICLGIISFMRGDSWLWEFLCWENLTKYFQFFTLGIICSKYRDRFFALLSSNLFITIMIIGWVVCMLLWYSPRFQASQPFAYSVVHDIAVRYFALLTVISVFFSNAKSLSADTRQARILQLIGRRTLDIYMIHYFLLPNLRFLTPWLESGNMLTLQLLIGGTVTIIIVALCILISNILRQSSTLRSWLFGVKPVIAQK